MTALATLITDTRILCNDTPTSNLITQEAPKGAINSSNTKYRLQYQLVVTGSVFLTQGSTFRTQSGFTLDLPNGILTMTSAPTSGTDPFEVDYNFNWFTDTDYTEFLAEAAKAVNNVADPTKIVDGLVPALLHFALYYFWMRRASQYAHKYQSSGGQAGQNVDVVTTNFRNLAKDAKAAALALRDDFYTEQGRAKNPAAAATNISFDPFTPRR